MSAPVPEYSPAMLSFFLRARAVLAHAELPSRSGIAVTVKREKRRWKQLSRLTHGQVDFAWMGRLRNAEARVRLWAVLGHFPADHGIVLTDDGGQRHG